jgi:hypothetical protein
MSDPITRELSPGFLVWVNVFDEILYRWVKVEGIVVRVTSLRWTEDRKVEHKPPMSWTAEVLVNNRIHHTVVERRNIIAEA